MIEHTQIRGEIVTFDGLYTSQEIAEYIDFIKSTTFDRKFSGFDFKNGRIIHHKLSNLIHTRLLQMGVVSKHYVDAKGQKWEYANTAPTIYYANYKTGQNFIIHTDTGSVYDPSNRLYSKFTLLTYLNDDFEGGETCFFNDALEEICAIRPKTGLTLFFDIDLMHNGAPIVGNNVHKFWIGTELVYKLLGNDVP